MARFSRLAPAAMLVGVTAIWGWTFVVVRAAVTSYPVLPFLAIRFVLAALFLVPIASRRNLGWRAGLAPGVVLAAGYGFQTAGLQYTSASKAGLLTGLMVVITPLLEWAVYGRRPTSTTLIAVTMAFAGTGLLTTGGNALIMRPHEVLGDSLEVLTGLCFAIHVILLGRVPQVADSAGVALCQMAVAASIFGAGAGVTGGIPVPSPAVWIALVITSGLASALAFWVQTFVQQRLSPSRTAVVLVMEPAFATVFGFLLAGDRFGHLQAVGAGLIMAALVVHEVAAPLLQRSPPRWAET